MSLLALDARLTQRVGAVALCVLGGLIAFFVVVYDRIEWGHHVRLRVYFHDTGGLREGAGFVVAGRSIGKVETIALSPRGAAGPLGGDEGVAVTVAISAADAARVTRGGDVFVASHGALSEKYLEIGAAPGPGPSLAEGDELLGKDPPSLDRVLQRTFDNLVAFSQFRDDLRPDFEALGARLTELQATAASLAPAAAGIIPLGIATNGLIAEAKQTWNVGLGGQPGVDRIRALIANARITVAQAKSMLDVLGARAEQLKTGAGGLSDRLGARGPAAIAAVELAIDRMKAAIAKIDPMLATIDDINSRFARGEGSLGRLANDPEFPEEAKELGKIMKRQPWKIIARPQN